MTDPRDPWCEESRAREASEDLSHPEFLAPDFPQTGWSATVIDSRGTAWGQPGAEFLPPDAASGASPDGRLGPVPSPGPSHASSRSLPTASRPGPGLGMTAFGVVVAMTLACVTFGYLVGRLMGSAMVQFGTPTFDPTEIMQAVPALSDQLSACVGLGFIASLIGIGGLGLAIRARLRGSAPSLSLTAVIIGLCSPMLAFIALLAATEPFIHQIS
ncbi:MAG TPA: hypothetical protein VFN73_11375 [Propionibacteriaceae bacterium]|nr:hypothetical protein [Propionibacteriaceae bacterium]